MWMDETRVGADAGEVLGSSMATAANMAMAHGLCEEGITSLVAMEHSMNSLIDSMSSL